LTLRAPLAKFLTMADDFAKTIAIPAPEGVRPAGRSRERSRGTAGACRAGRAGRGARGSRRTGRCGADRAECGGGHPQVSGRPRRGEGARSRAVRRARCFHLTAPPPLELVTRRAMRRM